jgi:uncharacterized protein YPO0396
MTDEPKPSGGFCLHRLELWNWGTFNGDVQVLEAAGGWSLLVGDNGSGKSTAIDALRTLLVPPKLLNFNDASGDGRKAAARDRTRRSYVRGAWSSSSTVDSTTPTTQNLRESGTMSGILAVFCEPRRDTFVTIAQILWEHDEQIREIYAVTPSRRSLRDLIQGCNTSAEVRRAAKTGGWELFESFASYSERMRGLLHIPGDRALEVFNRAIGMKEVGDIDAFVRQFMLPAADTISFIRETVQPHYRTLLDCWTAIERAERQIDLLMPVEEHARRVREGEARIEHLKDLQEVLPAYFATLHLALLEEYEGGLRATRAVRSGERDEVARRVSLVRRERDDLKAAVGATDVGMKIESLQREISDADVARRQAQQRRDSLEPLAASIESRPALHDAAAFAAARPVWERRELEESAAAALADEEAAAKKLRQDEALLRRVEANADIESALKNRVNIPRNFLEVRARVAQASGVDPEQMPFAGELIEVLESYADWTAAIERLLRGFGLSLLVRQDNYQRAADYINRTRLGLRLVFHEVRDATGQSPLLPTERVSGRLRFRQDHPLSGWVASEVVRQFRHQCCESIAELERTDRGLTREGLIRDGSRHTKDDSRGIDDLSNRILGWSTESKIEALKRVVLEAELQATEHGQAAVAARRRATLARERADAARRLLAVTEFGEIAPERWSERILRLRAEKELLEKGSTELQRLRQRIDEVEIEIADCEKALAVLDGDLGRIDGLVQTNAAKVGRCRGPLADSPPCDPVVTGESLNSTLKPAPVLSLENADDLGRQTHVRLQGVINAEAARVRDADGKMSANMGEFLAQFPEFRQTLEVDRSFASSFGEVLQRIQGEDLPKHRASFEKYLNENLVGSLLMLQNRLEEHEGAIEERIQETNEALGRIDYSDDTYVQIRLVPRPTNEIVTFKASLKACFEYGINPTEAQRITLFNRIRGLLERFQAEPEVTQRVTDVRNWFASGVRELRRLDESEVNFFAATTGKSGGQKAKLAFTILASALSAQYGLSVSSSDVPNFRLVIIDEAFSRTDESNSTRAMKLFKQLGFQLLIVGQFDAKAKLAVPFVDTIHLASNPAGSSSRLSALTREEATAAEAAA